MNIEAAIRLLGTRLMPCAALFVLAWPLTAYAAAPNDEGAAPSPLQDEQQVLAYWTVERLREAAEIDNPADLRPLEPPLGGDEYGYVLMPRPYKARDVSRVTGVLFSYNPVVNKDTHCSAAVLQSRSKSLIITAAHCLITYNLTPGGKTWSEKMLFVPAYDGVGVKDLHELAPYGVWPVTHGYVTTRVAQTPLLAAGARDDLGIASVFPQQGQRLENVVGASLAALMNDQEVFPSAVITGYPAGRYNGYTQYQCTTRLTENNYGGIDSPNCGVVGGNSGGPVIVGSQVVAVVHGREQTRLRPEIYPSLARAAELDYPGP